MFQTKFSPSQTPSSTRNLFVDAHKPPIRGLLKLSIIQAAPSYIPYEDLLPVRAFKSSLVPELAVFFWAIENDRCTLAAE
jgi:hypothetical protein